METWHFAQNAEHRSTIKAVLAPRVVNRYRIPKKTHRAACQLLRRLHQALYRLHQRFPLQHAGKMARYVITMPKNPLPDSVRDAASMFAGTAQMHIP